MSEPDKRKKRAPGRTPTPEKFQPRVLLIWLAIFAAILALWLANPNGSSPIREISIQEVIRDAEADRIAKGIIQSDPNFGHMDAVRIAG
jgi:cell division protease FtsH